MRYTVREGQQSDMERTDPPQPPPGIPEPLFSRLASLSRMADLLPKPPPPPPYPRFFYGPTNRRDYLRLLLLREVVRDPHGPLQTWLSNLERSLWDRAEQEAHRWREEREAEYEKELAQDATAAFNLARRRLGLEPEPSDDATAEYYKSQPRAERLDYLAGVFEGWLRSLLDSTETAESLASGSAEALGREYAKQMAREPRQQPLEENEIRPELDRARDAILADEMGLRRQAEEIVYSLHVHTVAHGWLVEAVLHEARETITRVAPFPPLPPLPSFILPPWVPPWRQDRIDLPRRVDVRVVIYDDEDADAANQKLDEAKKTLKEIRRRHPGPTQKPPADDELVRLLYRSLKGESYRDLASGLSGDHSVHYKTLARYLRQVKDIVFSSQE